MENNKSNIEGMVITINGKNYRLVEIKENGNNCDKKANALVSLQTPFGEITKVYPLFSGDGERVFGVPEGTYNNNGDTFTVRYATEEETKAYAKAANESRKNIPPQVRALMDILLSELDECAE